MIQYIETMKKKIILRFSCFKVNIFCFSDSFDINTSIDISIILENPPTSTFCKMVKKTIVKERSKKN